MDCGRAVMFLIVCGNRVLLEARPDNEHGFSNETIIPGGKNEDNEEHDDAVLREIMEETGLKNINPLPLGQSFKAITTNAHLYEMQAYLVKIDDENMIENINPEKGKHVWVGFEEARRNITWSHSQLVFERAKVLVKGSG